MPAKKKIQIPKQRLNIESFYKRWDIQLSENERWDNFKNRILNAFSEKIGYSFLGQSELEDEFFNIIGIHARKIRGIHDTDFLFNKLLSDSPAYNYFLDQTDIKKIILGLEVIFWMQSLDPIKKQDFFLEIQTAIETTGVPLVLKQSKSDLLFFPAGAKLLDIKLVNDNLDWLVSYPKSYDSFKAALTDIGRKGKERVVLDNLRLSLELLLKNVMGNNKSLENQKTEIGKYLKDKNTSPEIANMFWQILDYYSKYQNDKAKHGDNAKHDEIEFILYLTGTIMRFILTK